MLKLIPANDLTNELMLSHLGSYGNRSHRLLFHKAEQAHLEMGPGPLTCLLSAAAVVYDTNDCASLCVNMARTKQTHRRLLFRRTAATFEASVQGAVIHSQSSSTMERSVNEAAGNFGAGTTAAPKSCAASKVTVAKKRGRPATRSLTCDICGRMFAHRASIIRHRKTAHLINAADEPIDIQERFEIRHELSRSSPSDTATPERTSPRRAEGNRGSTVERDRQVPLLGGLRTTIISEPSFPEPMSTSRSVAVCRSKPSPQNLVAFRSKT